jgi:hypothetical protein
LDNNPVHSRKYFELRADWQGSTLAGTSSIKSWTQKCTYETGHANVECEALDSREAAALRDTRDTGDDNVRLMAMFAAPVSGGLLVSLQPKPEDARVNPYVAFASAVSGFGAGFLYGRSIRPNEAGKAFNELLKDNRSAWAQFDNFMRSNLDFAIRYADAHGGAAPPELLDLFATHPGLWRSFCRISAKNKFESVPALPKSQKSGRLLVDW